MRPVFDLHRWTSRVGTFILVFILTGCTGLGSSPVGETKAAAATAVTPSPTMAISPTAASMRTLVVQYTPTPRLITPAPVEGTVIDNSMQSPDGVWTAEPVFENLTNGYHVSLRVFNSEKSIVWTPVDYEGEGLGYMAPTPKGWSTDSRYFYYAETTVTDGCADFSPLETIWQQLDVETGEVLPFHLPAGRGHQFSPDGSRLAYANPGAPLELVIQDTATQVEVKILLLPDGSITEKAQAGRIVWSPAGNALTLAVQAGDTCEGQTPIFYFLKVQLEELDTLSLYEGKDLVYPLEWHASGKILVKDWSLRSWWVDSVSGEVTAAP